MPAAVGNAAFYILYTYCGAIDIANGALARHCGTASRFGAALDSAADFIFLLAAVEEVLILLRCKQFDANIRGLHI